jgi:hypothetical protein
MPHQSSPQSSDRDYAHRAAVLRRYGWPVKGYRQGRAIPAATKSAITRLWEAHKSHIAVGRDKQPVRFERLTKAELRLARKVVSREAITPKGVILQVPRGVRPADYRFRIGRSNTGTLRVEETIRRRMTDVVIRPNYREMIMDPRGYIVEIVRREKLAAPLKRVKGRGGKPGKMVPRRLRGVKVVVGGMESTGALVSPSQIGRYMDEIWDSFVGDLDEYADPDEYAARAKEFSDKFQLRLIFDND